MSEQLEIFASGGQKWRNLLFNLNSKQSQLYNQNDQHEVLIPELPLKLKSIAYDSRNKQICILPISHTMGIFLTLGFSMNKGQAVIF